MRNIARTPPITLMIATQMAAKQALMPDINNTDNIGQKQDLKPVFWKIWTPQKITAKGPEPITNLETYSKCLNTTGDSVTGSLQ